MSNEKDGIFIVLDEPSKKYYYQGETISGEVVVRTKQEISTREIILDLAALGIKVSITVTSRAVLRLSDLMEAGNTCDERTYVNATFLEVGNGKEEFKIPSGKISYPFKGILPAGSNLPCSFEWQPLDSYEDVEANVEYFINAEVILGSWYKSNWRSTQTIVVRRVVDLNMFPGLRNPVVLSNSLNNSYSQGCCFCCGGSPAPTPVSLSARLNRTGFCPGEIVKFDLVVYDGGADNLGSLSVAVIAALGMYGKEAFAPCKWPVVSKELQLTREPSTGPRNFIVADELILPRDLVPTNLGTGTPINMIDLKYYFEVKLEDVVAGFATGPLKLLMPIYIGTAPFKPLSLATPMSTAESDTTSISSM